MSELARARNFALEIAGADACDRLGRPGAGTVAAVFASSFYIGVHRSYVCIGTSGIGMGPLNARSAAPVTVDWQAVGLRRGHPAVVHDQSVDVGELVCFDTAGMATWSPAPVEWTSAVVAERLALLEGLMEAAMPSEGLAPLLFSTHRSSSEALRLATEPYLQLRDWLECVFRHDGRADEGLDGVERLLGLGPGLTPSGDDLIGGVMITLGLLKHETALAALGSMTRQYSGARTVPLSAAHLSGAARGMGSEALHDLLAALAGAPVVDLSKSLDRVARIGHTSGWDALTGVVTTARAWLGAGPAAEMVAEATA